MNVSKNRAALNKSNHLDDDDEFHNDDYSDEDKVSKVSKMSDNKERNKFKKSITQKTAKGPKVDIPNMVDSSQTSDTEDSDMSLGYDNAIQFTLKDFYDYEIFPESTGAAVLPWTDFTRDFLSLDIAMTPPTK
jgi:hypothetical protein